MEILSVRDLSFRYPGEEEKALNEIFFTIQPGDFTVLCGETGCGKTTLLKLLKREIAPHGEIHGEIYYNGNLLDQLDQRTLAGEIGYVFQNPASQIVTDRVWHELAFGLENLGVETSVIRRRTGEIASFFGIEKWFMESIDHLSGGQKQLLNLASVMVMQPNLILLDEPTSQLDPIAASEFIGTLYKINRELGLTVMLAEHRLEDVFPIADRILLIEKGKVVLHEPPRDVALHLREFDSNHPMLNALPSAARIFSGLHLEGECPLTVKEGRNTLTLRFAQDLPDRDRYMKPTSVTLPSSEPEQTIAVELDDVWFRYGRELSDVMRGVTFSVREGEIYCILGGNGSGKTTTLNVLCGLSRAYRGKIRIFGKKLDDYRFGELYRNHLAFLPQDSMLVFAGETVLEDFLEVCETMGYTKEESETQIETLCERFKVNHLTQRHPYDLSGGEQQKCALVKLLLLKPRILLLDEPTKGFDSFAKRGLFEILRQLKKESMTVIIVTHDVEFAAVNADRCAMFFNGEILSEDSPSHFFSQNNFYTTAANRIGRHLFPYAVTCEEVIRSCLEI
jgi:energy-coupling factor transport system ATP-binding protein